MKKVLLFTLLLSFSFSVFANSIGETLLPMMDVTLESCDEDNDGSGEFNLASSINAILGNRNPDDFTVTIHESSEDAMDDEDAIDLSTMYSSGSRVLYARTERNDDDSDFEISEVSLVLSSPPITTFANDVVYEFCSDSTEPLTIVSEGVNYQGTNNIVFRWFRDGEEIPNETGSSLKVLSAGLYEVETTFFSSGCSARYQVEVAEANNCIVPQGISPNGDGFNDTFDLTDFRVTNIEIFNRYGTKVFSQSNYTNEWRGQNEDGEDLPVGTYYYTMVFKEGQRTSGWVYIQRAK